MTPLTRRPAAASARDMEHTNNIPDREAMPEDIL